MYSKDRATCILKTATSAQKDFKGLCNMCSKDRATCTLRTVQQPMGARMTSARSERVPAPRTSCSFSTKIIMHALPAFTFQSNGGGRGQGGGILTL